MGSPNFLLTKNAAILFRTEDVAPRQTLPQTYTNTGCSRKKTAGHFCSLGFQKKNKFLLKPVCFGGERSILLIHRRLITTKEVYFYYIAFPDSFFSNTLTEWGKTGHSLTFQKTRQNPVFYRIQNECKSG